MGRGAAVYDVRPLVQLQKQQQHSTQARRLIEAREERKEKKNAVQRREKQRGWSIRGRGEGEGERLGPGGQRPEQQHKQERERESS